MTAPATRVWQGIEAADPPLERFDHAALLATAEAMLATRQRRFPAMIASGALGADAAAAELATFAAIAADWRWIVTGEGAPATAATLAARRAALDASIATIADLARDAGGFSDALADQCQRVIALRWHLEPGSQTHFCAAVNHQLRRLYSQGDRSRAA